MSVDAAQQTFAHMAFPNENAEYRRARNALLEAEIDLRRRTEEVAVMRRVLPPGGEVPEDFVFERIGPYFRPEQVRLSQLFGDHPAVMLYSFMFGPERDDPCPGCTHLFAPDEPGQHHRGLDFADPVWGLLDTTPEGRGREFFPQVTY